MKGLIDKFYNGTCTPAEAKLVMDWLLQQEEEEWDAIPSEEHPYEAEMLTVIKDRTFGKIKRFPWMKIAVAASILLLCSLSFMKREVVIPKKSDATGWVAFKAPLNKRVNIKLTDGSKILLEPSAMLRYDTVAYTQNRNLFLEGKALFEVAASTEHPFTVHANGSLVIALGTSFMVSAEKVQLFSGKVLIRKAGAKDVYLRAGEEMTYVRRKEVSVPVAERIMLKNIHVSNDNIVFNNVPLREVFDLFRDRYKITIQCDEQKLDAVYFSGKVLASDPVELILTTITRINNLTLTRKEGVYIIR